MLVVPAEVVSPDHGVMYCMQNLRYHTGAVHLANCNWRSGNIDNFAYGV